MCAQEKKIYSEEELFQIRMNRTYEERFRILMQLIRVNMKMKNAKIIYPDKK